MRPEEHTGVLNAIVRSVHCLRGGGTIEGFKQRRDAVRCRGCSAVGMKKERV